MAEQKKTVEATIRNICQATRKKYTAKENVRIVLEVLRGKSNPDKENRSIADFFSNHPDCDIGHYEGKGVSILSRGEWSSSARRMPVIDTIPRTAVCYYVCIWCLNARGNSRRGSDRCRSRIRGMRNGIRIRNGTRTVGSDLPPFFEVILKIGAGQSCRKRRAISKLPRK